MNKNDRERQLERCKYAVEKCEMGDLLSPEELLGMMENLEKLKNETVVQEE